MSIDTIRRIIPKIGSSKSKKFFLDFRQELAKTILGLESTIVEEISKLFTIDSIISGSSDIKIRVRDESNGWEKIVSVILRYHHDDAKYGNVHIEILASELSKKNKSHFLWKYLITDRKNIYTDVQKTLILAIRAIY